MVVSFLRTKSDLNSAMEKSPRVQRSVQPEVDQEAKQWNTYVDTLKRTVNSMHEICLSKQNVLGCEEALMYLTSAVRDFQSLISSINVEVEWENSENRPSTVSWEVIGTNRRKGLKQLTENLPIQQKSTNDSCVQCRAKRRMNADLSDDENKKTTNDVYERLAYGKRSNVSRHIDIVEKQDMEELKKQGCITGKLITPKSAMDIPQTKSSMAKIAASRQLLWQRHKKILTEKLSAKRRQEHSLATLGNRRRSLPMLAKEVVNVKTTAETNLEAIHEAHEDDKPEGDVDNTSTKTHAGHFKTRSDGYAFDLLDMRFDDEWKALTEEEESLAQEEESLKKEIEETESISIDDELQRRVILDFSDVAIESDWQSVVGNWTIDDNGEEDADLIRENAVETPKLVQQACRFRQPGELVQIHQRLLSPLRKRNLNAEEIKDRQNKAEELRLMLQEQKSQRLRILLSKVEDVRQKRERLLEKKRIHLETKMQKAAENRQKNLDEIIKRAKDDDQKVLETNFINTMENERVRLDLQLREKEQEQRLLNLAEERSKQVRFKATKGAALDERKRTAEQQKSERLREQAVKKQERQHLIETQRNEAVESQRKKIRLYEQKIESIKTNEILEVESLRNKIQDKATKGAKRHELLVERIRQKAIESSRLNVFSSLADLAAPPSDLQYSLTDNNCCKKCMKCDYLATSDLNLIGHLLSAEHLAKSSLQLTDVNFIYLKSELENVVQLVDGTAILDNETLDLPPPTPNKKLRAKLKQKLATIDLKLDFSASNTTLRQNFDKKSGELRNLLSERSKSNEQGRKKLEHCLSDLRRFVVDQKPENRYQIGIFGQQSGLIMSLIDFIVGNSSNVFECSSKVFYRLICKMSHFLLEILTSNPKVCATLLFSDCTFNLVEWSTNQIESGISNGNLDECSEVIVSVFCILSTLLKEGSAFVQTDLVQFLPQLNERLQSIATYLTNSNFIAYYKHIVLNGIEPIEFGFGHSVRPLTILSGLITALSIDPRVNEKSESQILNLHMMAIQSLISEIYAKIRFDSVIQSDSSNSGTLMTTSLMSSNSSNWHSNSNVEIECTALLLLWNSLNNKITSDSPAKQKILESVNDDEALRFVYILLVSIYNTDKSANLMTTNPGPLICILKATAHFASLSPKHQLICTVGWQKSLLVQICKLPFEYFQNPNMRFNLLTTLIVILFDNKEGVALIREYITPTWMVEFMKELLNSNGQSGEEEIRRFEQLIPQNKWRSALEFFENTQL